MLNQPVEVAPLDPKDDAQWAGYHRVTVDAQVHERPYGDVPTADAFRVSFVRASQSSRTLGWTARLDGAVVGAAMVVLPLADNTHLAFTEVNVTPSARRRGVGRALLAGLDDGLRAAGRHTDLGGGPPPVRGGRRRWARGRRGRLRPRQRVRARPDRGALRAAQPAGPPPA
ncbi:MAG: GNAT family N-acetyltransferase [Actinomycetota bacterium]|nr:GNAT family N-acetyltransferase [Actinomycetota bacterium]